MVVTDDKVGLSTLTTNTYDKPDMISTTSSALNTSAPNMIGRAMDKAVDAITGFVSKLSNKPGNTITPSRISRALNNPIAKGLSAAAGTIREEMDKTNPYPDNGISQFGNMVSNIAAPHRGFAAVVGRVANKISDSFPNYVSEVAARAAQDYIKAVDSISINDGLKIGSSLVGGESFDDAPTIEEQLTVPSTLPSIEINNNSRDDEQIPSSDDNLHSTDESNSEAVIMTVPSGGGGGITMVSPSGGDAAKEKKRRRRRKKKKPGKGNSNT